MDPSNFISNTMAFVEFANQYIYRPNFKEVGYGESSYGILVVKHDPYVFSRPRFFIYLVIAVGMVACVLTLLSTMKKSSINTFREPLFSPEVDSKRKWLTLLSCLSIISSGVHHIDNFLRVEQYFLPSGIYNGFFFILDVGLANWVIAALFLTFGVRHILLHSAEFFTQYDTRNYFDMHHFAVYGVYIHCVMIWSGQLHYSIKSFYNFSATSNISILLEGWSAIILNIYAIYLHCNVFTCTPASVEVADRANNDDENASFLDRRSEFHDKCGTIEGSIGELELSQNTIRRRSK